MERRCVYFPVPQARSGEVSSAKNPREEIRDKVTLYSSLDIKASSLSST